jgi:hypothetical protein
VDNLPVAFGDALRVKGSTGNDLAGDRQQLTQRGLVQPAVRQPLRYVAERADLPPREPGLPEFGGIDGQQSGGRGEMPVKEGPDAGKGTAGRCDRQLLRDDLEQQPITPKVSRRRRSQTLLIEVASDMRFTLLPVS